ncbi:MAG: polyphosphate polymerase domain-containing protein [Lachnospiraceae bacterium]
MAIEVFNRYEKKFLLDDKTYYSIIMDIQDYMEDDVYNLDNDFYTIANIYYDTSDDELIRKSLEKPVYKEKLRLRSYGVPDINDNVFLEIKKKYKGIVNKRRTELKLSDAYRFMKDEISAEKIFNQDGNANEQVLRELEYFKKIYKLEPKVYIAYDRKAFFAKDDPDFRLTFDTNIRTRRDDVSLEAGDYGEKLLPDGLWLMEIKIKDAIPLWFARILAEKGLCPVSFSKYGTEYKKYYNNSLGGKMICLNQYLVQHRQSQELQLIAQ